MFPVDAFRSTLTKAIAIFEQHSIRFHLTGGITSVVYGEPRMTQDIDIVIDNHAAATKRQSIDQFASQHGLDQLLHEICAEADELT